MQGWKNKHREIRRHRMMCTNEGDWTRSHPPNVQHHQCLALEASMKHLLSQPWVAHSGSKVHEKGVNLEDKVMPCPWNRRCGGDRNVWDEGEGQKLAGVFPWWCLFSPRSRRWGVGQRRESKWLIAWVNFGYWDGLSQISHFRKQNPQLLICKRIAI